MTDRTSAKRQSRRLAALDSAARWLGFDSWRKLETAVINGRVKLVAVPEDDNDASAEPPARLKVYVD